MSMYDLNLFPYNDIPEDWEKGEHGWEGRGAIDDEEGNVVDLEAIGKVSNACPSRVIVSYDDDFMAAVYELGGKLIHMTLNSPRLREEVVADHCDVVGHPG